MIIWYEGNNCVFELAFCSLLFCDFKFMLSVNKSFVVYFCLSGKVRFSLIFILTVILHYIQGKQHVRPGYSNNPSFNPPPGEHVKCHRSYTDLCNVGGSSLCVICFSKFLYLEIFIYFTLSKTVYLQ